LKSHIVFRLEVFSEIPKWKAEQRRKDAEDIATGRRTRRSFAFSKRFGIEREGRGDILLEAHADVTGVQSARCGNPSQKNKGGD